MGKSSLIIVLGFTVVFGWITRGNYRKSLDATDNFIDDYERVAARNTTNSAIDIALRELTANNNWAGCTDESLFDGTYSVVIQDSTEDPSLSSDQIQLICTLQAGEISDTVRVVLEEENQIPTPTAAMGFSGDNISYNFGGSSFSVDGTDTNPDGTPGPGPDVPGLTVPDSSDSAGAVAALPDTSMISGAGGSPSVGVSTDSTDLSYLGGWFRSRADYDLPGGVYDSYTWGTLASPCIVYIDGNAVLTGTTSGAGVLIIEGNLEFRGECVWLGTVMVFGSTVTLSAAVGNPTIYGALLMQADTATLDITGNVSLAYSSYAIQTVQENLSTSNLYQVVSRWE